MAHRPFDASRAFAFLDDVAARFGPSAFPSIEPAWDAAWVTCMTSDLRHDTAAEAALGELVIEVDRMSIGHVLARADASAAQVLL